MTFAQGKLYEERAALLNNTRSTAERKENHDNQVLNILNVFGKIRAKNTRNAVPWGGWYIRNNIDAVNCAIKEKKPIFVHAIFSQGPLYTYLIHCAFHIRDRRDIMYAWTQVKNKKLFNSNKLNQNHLFTWGHVESLHSSLQEISNLLSFSYLFNALFFEAKRAIHTILNSSQNHLHLK